MSIEERFSNVEVNLSALEQRVKDRIENDNKLFTQLNENITNLTEKIDGFLLREAKREGEQRGMIRSIVIVAGGISFTISILGFVLDKLV